MSRYLNVFHSYSQGEFGNIESERILENNVTRALVVTLRSSSGLCGWLLSRLFEIETGGEYEYQLQKKLGELAVDSEEIRPVSGWRQRFVLGIAPKAEFREEEISDSLLERLEDLEESDKKEFQRLLIARSNELERETATDKGRVQRLEHLLGEGIEKLDGSELRYLYDLTLGSRPDAVITDKKAKLAVLVESKIHGRLVGAQIRRHIKENFNGFLPCYFIYGKQQVPGVNAKEVVTCICSWRDIFALLKSFDSKSHGSSVEKFLVEQFLEYLEVIGMGELSFKQSEFLRWQEHYHDDKEVAHSLLEKIQALAEELGQLLPDHRVKVQAVRPDYLGVNIVGSKGDQRKLMPVEIPHWSLALQQYGAEGHSLRLFIQCESKELVKGLVDQRHDLEPKLVTALSDLKGKTNIVLRTQEKLHLMYGGKAEVQPVWHVYFSAPLELCYDNDDVERAIKQAFDSIAHLLDPHVRAGRIQKLPEKMTSVKGKTVTGVLQLNYHVNWLELERLGIDILDNLKDVVNWFKPYYNVLSAAAAKLE